jgi:hypothetical protein
MEILTGMKPGKRLKNGGFSKNSIYEAVDERLAELAELADMNGTRKRRRKRKKAISHPGEASDHKDDPATIQVHE